MKTTNFCRTARGAYAASMERCGVQVYGACLELHKGRSAMLIVSMSDAEQAHTADQLLGAIPAQKLIAAFEGDAKAAGGFLRQLRTVAERLAAAEGSDNAQ